MAPLRKSCNTLEIGTGSRAPEILKVGVGATCYLTFPTQRNVLARFWSGLGLVGSESRSGFGRVWVWVRVQVWSVGSGSGFGLVWQIARTFGVNGKLGCLRKSLGLSS